MKKLLKTDTPKVSAAAQQAGVTAIQSAWAEGDNIHLVTPYGVTIVAPADGRTEAIPRPAPGKIYADFTKISGIGKVTADALHRVGYTSFAQLKAAEPGNLLPIPHVTKNTIQAIANHKEG